MLLAGTTDDLLPLGRYSGYASAEEGEDGLQDFFI
jgi:hypothetical protein